jgi:hypothetical protein
MTQNLEDYQTLKQFLYKSFEDLVNIKNTQPVTKHVDARNGDEDEMSQQEKTNLDDDMGYDE